MSHNFKNVLNEHYSKPFIDGDIKYGCIFCGCNTNYEHKKVTIVDLLENLLAQMISRESLRFYLSVAGQLIVI